VKSLLSHQLLRVLVGVADEEEDRAEEVDFEVGDTRGVRVAFAVVVVRREDEEERFDEVVVVLSRGEIVSGGEGKPSERQEGGLTLRHWVA